MFYLLLLFRNIHKLIISFNFVGVTRVHVMHWNKSECPQHVITNLPAEPEILFPTFSEHEPRRTSPDTASNAGGCWGGGCRSEEQRAGRFNGIIFDNNCIYDIKKKDKKRKKYVQNSRLTLSHHKQYLK